VDVIRAIHSDAGKTVVLTTHYLEEAETLCDRVAIMDESRVIALDTPAGLIASLGAEVRISYTEGGEERVAYAHDAQAAVLETLEAARQRGVRPRARRARPQPGRRVPEADRAGVPRMTLTRIGATTLAQMKMMFRRRIVLFWSLVFPIILMALLGLLFGRSIDAGTITVIDASHTQASAAMVHALSSTKGVTVKTDQTDVAHARKQVQDGDRDALVVLTKTPTGDPAHLYYSNASATQAASSAGSCPAHRRDIRGQRRPRQSSSASSRWTPPRSATSTSCCRASWRWRS
jgi:ABC-type proline/glycine betaine transport system ATPase subunit